MLTGQPRRMDRTHGIGSRINSLYWCIRLCTGVAAGNRAVCSALFLQPQVQPALGQAVHWHVDWVVVFVAMRHSV
ncbi:hypothetical protein UB46_38915 [Burkholderiaceae bacterium 16]|nr:hypothetical protein UB46_38915 [Burkholderiaceae bacterium 16]